MKTRRRARGAEHALPPYVPYGTFREFIRDLVKNPGHTIPRRLDASMIPSVSGAIKSQIIGALRYLGLIDRTGYATEKLTKMARAEGPEFKKALYEALTASYSTLFADLDVTKATPREIREKLAKSGATGETLRKCIAFFVAASKEAGLQLSPHIRPYAGSRGLGRQPRSRGRQPSLDAKSAADAIRATDTRVTNGKVLSDLREWLKNKLPDFDPTWPVEMKSKWLDEYGRIRELLEQETSRREAQDG